MGLGYQSQLEYKKKFLTASHSEFALRKFLMLSIPKLDGAFEINELAKNTLKAIQVKKPVTKPTEPTTIAKTNPRKKKKDFAYILIATLALFAIAYYTLGLESNTTDVPISTAADISSTPSMKASRINKSLDTSFIKSNLIYETINFINSILSSFRKYACSSSIHR